MRFPLRDIIEYAMTKPDEVNKGYVEFFGPLPFEELKPEWEELFLEWLIFDRKQSTGTTFLVEYVLRNPDKGDTQALDELEQIAKTHFYSQFQILQIERGEWIQVEDLQTGKKYKVYEKKGSMSLPGNGVIPGRLARVNRKWHLVGANSIYFPMTFTSRAKKNMRMAKMEDFSPRDTVDLLRSQEQQPPPSPPSVLTAKELVEKRKVLKEEYKKVAKKFAVTYTVDELLEEIYNENRTNVINFWQGLEKKGFKFEMLMENTELFEDLWNYFPHKCLNGKYPAQVFAEMKKKSKK